VENYSSTTPGEPGQATESASLMDQAKHQTQHAVKKTQEMAGQAVETARHQVETQLSSQKERAADTLGGVAEALRRTGEQLRQQDQTPFGEYADSAAQFIERFSDRLRERDIRQMFHEIEDLGRRNPALFLGGAFALGFLASRFLKSSSPYDGYYTGNGYGSMAAHELPTAYDRGYERAAAAAPPTTTFAPPAPSTRYESAASVDTTFPTRTEETADDEELAGAEDLTGVRQP